MSSKSAAQRSSPTKRTDNRQRPQPIQRQAMGGMPNPAEMQKRLGNQGTQAWLAEQRIQPKLTIGQPGDQYEQEADRTADTVMRMPDPGPPGDEETKRQTKPQLSVLQRSSLSTTKSQPVQRLCADCEKELGGQSDQKLQRKEDNERVPHVTPDIEANINALDGKGHPLPDSTRNYFEPRFGADFSQVRVNSDTRAADTAKSINAKAFTVGQNISFGAGQYAPESNAGKLLLAHELTHVVQQENVNDKVRRTCDPAVSTCPPQNTSLPPASQTHATQAGQVLARVQPLPEADRNTLRNAFAGAPILNYINERDRKRGELSEKNNELLRIRPEHGTPEPGGELEQQITRLTSDIEILNTEVLKLDNLVQAGLEALGLTEESQLTTLINETFPSLFINRAKEIAKAELDKNKFIVEEEAKRYGYNACVNSADKIGLINAAQDLLSRKASIADKENRLRDISRDLPSAGVPSPETMGSNYYDYVRYPEIIARERTELERVHGEYILQYPILARPSLDLNAIATGNEESVGNSINAEVTTLIENIEITKTNIDNEKIKIWDLRNIVEMTASDLGADENPDLMAAVNRHIQGQVSEEEAIQIALTALAITASIVATVATAGGYAVVAAGAAGMGVGLGAGQFANSVQQYIAQSHAQNVALDPALSDISIQNPDLTWVLISFAGIILDVLQARTVFNAVSRVARSLHTAEDVTRLGQLARAAGAPAIAAERLMTSGSNQLLRLALRETASQVGSAIALQGVANEFMGDEDAQMETVTVKVDVPSRESSEGGIPGIQRYPKPLPSWVPSSLPSGDTFEARIEGMLRRGTLPGFPQMDHVIYAQHNRSGHGIDLIGMSYNPDTGTMFLYRVEVKGGIAPYLNRTKRSGIQTGQEWTSNAIQRTMDNPRLRGLLERRFGFNIGESTRNPDVRRYILRRLREAPSFIVAHSSAYLGRLGATLGGMRSRGSPHAPRRIIRVP